MLFYSYIFPLCISYLRCSFIIPHSQIFARDNEGVLPTTKRALRNRDYKEALEEIEQQKNAWDDNKDQIQNYGEQVKKTSGFTKELTEKLSKENKVVRDGVQEFVDSGLAFDEFIKKKEEAFETDKDNQKPSSLKQSIKGIASSALTGILNGVVNASIGMIASSAIEVGFGMINELIHKNEIAMEEGESARDSVGLKPF